MPFPALSHVLAIFLISLSSISIDLQGVYAQRPATNLYLFDIHLATDEMPLTHPRLLTAFNLHGYNNQPNFFRPDEIWFTSDYQDTTQTDIWSLQLTTNTRRRVTRTRASEYSPAPIPGRPGFSTVVVETDGEDTQRLWKYPMVKGGQPLPLFPEITGVGYHCWLSGDSAALFIVGEPHSLHMAHASKDESTFMASRIGRCLLRDEAGRLLFLQKVTDTDWYIKRYDPAYDRTEILIKSRPGSEDFCLLPDGSLLMAQGAVIYRYDPGKDITWRTFADLSVYGLLNITRIVNHEDRQLAIVNQPIAP